MLLSISTRARLALHRRPACAVPDLSYGDPVAITPNVGPLAFEGVRGDAANTHVHCGWN
jgi:hypothetical protein